MKNLKESANSFKVMTEAQAEQIQGGLQSAIKEDYGVVAANSQQTVSPDSPSPWAIAF